LVEGFLLTSYRRFFIYGSGSNASAYDYKDNDPRYVRSLISEDPQIVFNGKVDDVTDYTHTLLVAAITSVSSPTGNQIPIIRFEQAVSSVQPLYSLNVQAINTNPLTNCIECFISIKDGVKTYAGQTYRAGYVEASATTSGSDVVFSVVDPQASINFLLPLNSAGQVDLRNPNSRDGLILNGTSNFVSNPNISGFQNWGRTAFNQALGYIPPANDSNTIHGLIKNIRKSLFMAEESDVLANVNVEELQQAPECQIDNTDPLRKDNECKLLPTT